MLVRTGHMADRIEQIERKLQALGDQGSDSAPAGFAAWLQQDAVSSAGGVHAHAATATGQGRFDALIARIAASHDMDPDLVHAVVRAESNYNPHCVSSAGARGLMQLMPATARHLGVADSFDPEQNLDGGVRYLKRQLERFGNLRLALAAYNAGPGAVSQYGGIPPYRETQAYVPRVMRYYQERKAQVATGGAAAVGHSPGAVGVSATPRPQAQTLSTGGTDGRGAQTASDSVQPVAGGTQPPAIHSAATGQSHMPPPHTAPNGTDTGPSMPTGSTDAASAGGTLPHGTDSSGAHVAPAAVTGRRAGEAVQSMRPESHAVPPARTSAPGPVDAPSEPPAVHRDVSAPARTSAPGPADAPSEPPAVHRDVSAPARASSTIAGGGAEPYGHAVAHPAAAHRDVSAPARTSAPGPADAPSEPPAVHRDVSAPARAGSTIAGGGAEPYGHAVAHPAAAQPAPGSVTVTTGVPASAQHRPVSGPAGEADTHPAHDARMTHAIRSVPVKSDVLTDDWQDGRSTTGSPQRQVATSWAADAAARSARIAPVVPGHVAAMTGAAITHGQVRQAAPVAEAAAPGGDANAAHRPEQPLRTVAAGSDGRSMRAWSAVAGEAGGAQQGAGMPTASARVMPPPDAEVGTGRPGSQTAENGDAGSVRGAMAAEGSSTQPPMPVAGQLFEALRQPLRELTTAGMATRAGQPDGNVGPQQIAIELSPPELGRVHVRLALDESGAMLQVRAENMTAALQLESSFRGLEGRLEQMGVRLAGLQISCDASGGSAMGNDGHARSEAWIGNSEMALPPQQAVEMSETLASEHASHRDGTSDKRPRVLDAVA